MVLLLLACSACRPEGASVVAPIDEPGDPTGYQLELQGLDQRIAFLRQRLAQREDWSLRAMLASAHQQRGRLTGSLDDYALAEADYALCFESAAEGAGPFLGRASLNHSLHRLPLIEADLQAAEEAILIDSETRASIALLRGKVTWQQGRYAEGEALVAQAQALAPNLGSSAELALEAWRRGDGETAEARFDEAEAGYRGTWREPLAWLDLQRGLMDLERGRSDLALEHYAAADALLDGWWLVREHVAEALVLEGRTAEARLIYEEVVAETGSPELEAALGELLISLGEEEAGHAHLARAAEGFARDLERFPEATAGHALDFQLAHGEPTLALELAERNAALRPNGAALARLGEALLLNDRPADAVAALQPALESSWVHPELYAVAARAYAAADQPEEAARWAERATALDPGAMD